MKRLTLILSVIALGLNVAQALIPAAPSNLSATAGGCLKINLSWTDNSSDETGFRIERSADNVTFKQIALANTTTYISYEGYPGLRYFRVSAYNGSGNSPYSNTASSESGACATPTPTPTPIITPTSTATPVASATTTPNPCVTLDCYVNPMPLYAQRNAAFSNNGNEYCAPTTGAMMIQSQLDKPGVTVAPGSWTANNFSSDYTIKVLAEALAMQTNSNWGTTGYNVWRGFANPLADVTNSDGTASIYEEWPDWPTQRTLDGYKEKLRAGYAVGLLIDHVRENRIYDGFPSCNLTRYEYKKSGGHFVGVSGYDGNFFFVNNPMGPEYQKLEFGVMPHTKNGLFILVYPETNYLVPDTMNVNYIGPVGMNSVPTTCGTGDVSCECDEALGITKTPVYAGGVDRLSLPCTLTCVSAKATAAIGNVSGTRKPPPGG